LLASVLLRRAPGVANGIPFVAGLAVVDALAESCGVAAGLKWPNDVLVDGRKLAGILSEVAPGSSDGGTVAVALGLGLNLSVDRFPDGATGISLRSLVDEPPDAAMLLLAWAAALRRRLAVLESEGMAAMVADWRHHAVGLGNLVSVTSPTGSFDGLAVDVADDGALLVNSGGTVRRVLAGDVHLHRGPAT
jgi:BirA family biotin operon repressor/biotin-[acetyl-CoA-carboxylase] ligase